MRLSGALLTTCLLASLCGTSAEAPEDEIKNLPGWEGPLPSRWWSGHVPAGSEDGYEMFEHYVYIEAERDPKNAPIVLWTNGGPGASSLFGLFVELGPFILDDRSLTTESYQKTGVPSLFYNPQTWSKNANLLIINSPPPVGFSYCNPAGPSGNGTSCGVWNDTRTTNHNKDFLDNFVKLKFPELGGPDREWYFTGESYAGVYVPTLARAYLNDPKPVLNLAGFAVGDPCAGTEVICGPGYGPYYFIEFMHGHIQFSDKLYSQILTTCPLNQLKYGVKDSACSALLDQMHKEIGGFYVYNLYDQCTYENLDDVSAQEAGFMATPMASSHLTQWSEDRMHWDQSKRRFWSNSRISSSSGLVGNDGYPCGGPGALNLWVNSSIVRKALHVAEDSYFFSGDNGAGFNYEVTEKTLLPFYTKVAEGFKGAMKKPLRVLVYNGDADAAINALATQNWTVALGFEEERAWRPWTLDGMQQMGGYVTKYKAAGAFDYLTIRGSGHMVPEYEPKAAAVMLNRWLQGKDWPEYVAPGSKNQVFLRQAKVQRAAETNP